MNNKLVEELIGYVSTWHPTAHGFSVQYAPDLRRFVSDAQLADIHPNLPDAVRIMSLRESFAGVGSGSIHDLLKLWSAPLHVIDCKGRSVAVNDIYGIHIEDDVVFLNSDATTYTEQQTADGRTLVKIANDTKVQDLAVNSTWLNEKHPGWLARFETAQLLDCEVLDAVKYMMSSVTKPEVKDLPTDIAP